MGGALARGIHRADPDSKDYQLTLTAATETTLQHFADTGAKLTTDNVEAARGARIVVVAVKPWIATGVLEELKDVLNAEKPVVVSLVAGMTEEQFYQAIEYPYLDEMANAVCTPGYVPAPHPAFINAIPNIAAEVGQSLTAIYAGNEVAGDDFQAVFDLFSCVGHVYEAPDAKRLAAATQTASCGIAFAMRYIRAAEEAAIEAGLTPKDARSIVLDTVAGAATLLRQTGEHPEAAIDRVTTAGGLTIRALNAMERAGFTGSVLSAK